VWAAVSPKEERREGDGGVRYGDKSMGSRADRVLGKGEAHSARERRVWHDATATQEWCTNGPDTDGVRRARSEITQHA